MNRNSALSILLVVVAILLAGCGPSQPAPVSVPQSSFPASYDEVVKFCNTWNKDMGAPQILGLYEVQNREKAYISAVNSSMKITTAWSSQRRHWQPCPGVRCELKATWQDGRQNEKSFTTSNADRFVDPGNYFRIELVCQ